MSRWTMSGRHPIFASQKNSLLRLFTLLFGVWCFTLQCGCEQLGISYRDGSNDPAKEETPGGDSANQQNGLAGATNRALMVGSFNIENFGQSKSKKPDVIRKLQDLTYPYDILAVQEVVSKDLPIIKDFVNGLNVAKNTKFNFITSPRLGKTPQKEQYAFIYDTTRLELVGEPFVVQGVEGKMSREPLVARFRVRSHLTGDQKPFSFLLVNVHTAPKDAVDELNYVASVVSYVKEQVTDEDDILVAGDFNLDPDGIFQKTDFKKLATWKPALGQDIKTTVTDKKSYDNILFGAANTQEYLNRSGAINLKSYFQIPKESAEKISDHYPIWAAFSLSEAAGSATAAQAL